ncbi:MAG: PorV/PorQ family protein [candidate division Zixibacteria bacterium]|nr:PorV/PorQ family protein [candidate division Zixibacteria bacterium]
MKSIKTILCLVLVLALSASLFAGKAKTGTTAYPFLKIGVGAKSLSMGGAFVGLADDESAVFYNPAGIIGFQQKAISGSYMNYIADIQSGNLIAVLPKSSPAVVDVEGLGEEPVFHDAQSAFAFSVVYLNYGKIDETDYFGGSDMAIGATYARKLSPQLACGGTAKLIYQKIDQYSSTGLAVDAGLLYRLRDGRTNVGLSASNLGVQLSGLSPEHKDPLPITLRGGVSHRTRELPLTVALEAVYPTDNDIYGSIGLEIHPNIPIALRVGYSTFGQNYKTGGSKDNTAGFSFGAGFKLAKIAVDYAFLPYADLGSLHRVGFAYMW